MIDVDKKLKKPHYSAMNIISAFDTVAYRWHVVNHQQQRKYTGHHYTVHTTEVASIYGSYFPFEEVGIAAAHGHDLFEDTGVTASQLMNECAELMGEDFDKAKAFQVVFLIVELTDVFTSKRFPDMNRAARKHAERNRLATVSIQAQNIKLADLISNTKDIAENDPDFAVVYLQEKKDLLALFTNADSRMLRDATQQVTELSAKLGLTK
jgi:(p)ppGpp synthase/HD superfamily hydrolase